MTRGWLLAFLVFYSASLNGCSTVEGAAYGIKKDAGTAWAYVNKEDGWIKKTDNWMKENLW